MGRLWVLPALPWLLRVERLWALLLLRMTPKLWLV